MYARDHSLTYFIDWAVSLPAGRQAHLVVPSSRDCTQGLFDQPKYTIQGR